MRKREEIRHAVTVAILGLFLGLVLCLVLRRPVAVNADAYTSHRVAALGVILDNPTVAITTTTATTGATPTTGATSAQIQWKFGTVAGSYGTCTVQAKTTYDGTNFLTLGTAASVTATTGTLNAWTLLAQAPTTSVTTGTVSSTAALGFGQLTEYTFACTSYGTSAPVTISVIYQ
jgi:hypothetical protein